MDKQMYGNITNAGRTQFQFDKTYANRKIMETNMETDGIYAGRYVLVEYDDENLNGFTQVYKENGNFYYVNHPGIIAKPYTDEQGSATISVGEYCYIAVEQPKEPQDNLNDIGRLEFYKTTEAGFELLGTGEDNAYSSNWKIDYDAYGRGYDSTVWQKIYIDGKQKYMMIAELNTILPTFTMSSDAPEMNPNEPHFNKVSDLEYDLHLQPQWGMRVAEAKDERFTDEKTIHENLDGKTKEVDADIYFYKDAFYKFVYKECDWSGEYVTPWQPGVYYKESNGGYKLAEEDKYDKTKIYYELVEVQGTEPIYKEIRLMQDDEIAYVPGKFYYIQSIRYEISTTEEPEENTTYYQKTSNSYNTDTIFRPVTFSENNPYVPNQYYIAIQDIIRDDGETAAVGRDYYEEKINEDGTVQYIFPRDERGNRLYPTSNPAYVPGKYYYKVFDEKIYILDYSDRPLEGVKYYKRTGLNTYVLVRFHSNYEKNIYYYLNEDNEYILSTDETEVPNRVYYRRAIYAEPSDLQNSYIKIVPTGVSGRLYNDHNGNKITAKDIQEISIMLPELGNALAELWNLMYTKQRNDIIYSSPYYNENMYDENGNPLYSTDLNSAVGIMNTLLDMIGHNLRYVEIEQITGKYFWYDLENNRLYLMNNNEIARELNEEEDKSFIYIYNGEFYQLINTYNKTSVYDDTYESNKYYELIDNEYVLVADENFDETKEYYEYITIFKIDTLNSEVASVYNMFLAVNQLLGANEDSNIDPNTIHGCLNALQNKLIELSKGISFITSPDETIFVEETSINENSMAQYYIRHATRDEMNSNTTETRYYDIAENKKMLVNVSPANDEITMLTPSYYYHPRLEYNNTGHIINMTDPLYTLLPQAVVGSLESNTYAMSETFLNSLPVGTLWLDIGTELNI